MKEIRNPKSEIRNKSKIKNRWVALGLFFVIVPIIHAKWPHVAFPIGEDRVDLHLGIFTLSLLYIALAAGLNLTIGFIGMLDLGFAAFIGIGGYTMASLSLSSALPFWMIIPIAAIIAGIVRAALGATCLRLRGDYLAIVTLGFGEIFVTLAKNDPGGLTGGPDGLTISMLRLSMTDHTRYFISLGIAVLTVYGCYRIKFSRLGRAFEAVREDDIAAEAMGIPVFRTKLLAYTLGGIIAGMAGSMLAIESSTAAPSNYDFFESARLVAMVVVGGTGSLFGSAFGAMFFVILLELFRPLAQYRLLLFGALMIAVMIGRPGGFFNVERRLAEPRNRIARGPEQP